MKLVILDRDGTLNEDRDDYVKSVDEWIALPGALEAIAQLNHAGWHTVVATNQSGLARGLFDMSALNGMHAHMNRELARVGGRIDAVFFCPHGPDDACRCRKPLPGLLETIVARYAVEPASTHMVGDTLRDLQAGAAIGCRTHLVLTGKSAGLSADAVDALLAQVPGTQAHPSLAAFAEALLADDAREQERARGLETARQAELARRAAPQPGVPAA